MRGEKRRSHIWSGRHSPWKMWPAGEPDRTLDVGRRQHLAGDDALDDVRGESRDLGKRLVGDGLASFVPTSRSASV